MINQPSKEELEAIKMLSDSELIKLSFDIGEIQRQNSYAKALIDLMEELVKNKDLKGIEAYVKAQKGNLEAKSLMPLAKAICRELEKRNIGGGQAGD